MSFVTEPSQRDYFEKTLRAVIALKPMIASFEDRIERERRLPLELVDALRQAGVFRMTVPSEWGGPELDPLSQIKIIEALSEANASVGWCVMIGADSGYFTSLLDQAVAREMYKDIDAITGGAVVPTGRAVEVEGGFLISGRWPFCSGCQHSDWLLAGCKVYDGDVPQQRPGDIPRTIQAFVPREAVTILDTWHALGLRGSGSHDFTIDNLFVAAERTFSFQDLKVHNPKPLYRFPLAFLFNFAAPPLGIAQAALNAFVDESSRPARQMTLEGRIVPSRRLRDEGFVQDAIGRASALIGAARAYLYGTIGDMWKTLQAGHDLSNPQLARFQSLNTQVFGMCLEAVHLIFKAKGGPSVYSGSVLERCLRDMQTIDQHAINSLRAYGQSGRMLMGLPPEEFLL